jgi:hypothetical protein
MLEQGQLVICWDKQKLGADLGVFKEYNEDGSFSTVNSNINYTNYEIPTVDYFRKNYYKVAIILNIGGVFDWEEEINKQDLFSDGKV